MMMMICTFFRMLSLPAVVGFAHTPSVSVEDLCEALVTYSNDGCGLDTTGQDDKRACVVELSVFSGSDGVFSTYEAAAALDTVPDALITAIGAVDVGATCQRERLRSTINEGRSWEEFYHRATFELFVSPPKRSWAGKEASYNGAFHVNRHLDGIGIFINGAVSIIEASKAVSKA